MTTLSPDEIAGALMRPQWRELHKVIAQDVALTDHLQTELAGVAFDVDGMTKGLRAMFAFVKAWTDEHGPLPTTWEMVQADRAGKLEEFIERVNAEWASRS